MPSCSIEGCENDAVARSWCPKHWARWRRTGDPLATKMPSRGLSAPDRFWGLVDRGSVLSDFAPELGPCWIFRGTPSKRYGLFTDVVGHTVQAHVYAWNLLNGPVASGLYLDHLCMVKKCVKVTADVDGPAHLEPVEPRENSLRYQRSLQRVAA